MLLNKPGAGNPGTFGSATTCGVAKVGSAAFSRRRIRLTARSVLRPVVPRAIAGSQMPVSIIASMIPPLIRADHG